MLSIANVILLEIVVIFIVIVKSDTRQIHYVSTTELINTAASAKLQNNFESTNDVNDVKVVDEKTGIKYNPYSKHHPGRHVCTNQRNVTYPIKTKQVFCKPTYKKYRVRCGGGDQWCAGVKLVYEKYHRDVVMGSYTQQVPSYTCCPGWTQVNGWNHGCQKLIDPCNTRTNSPSMCAVPCKNGGVCIQPNTCSCPSGFVGAVCEKVTRIYLPPDCELLCQNGGTCSPSTATCQCPPGFTGKRCESDVNECKMYKPCDHVCHNTHGSFKCECKEDFSLQDDGQSCRRDESDIDAFEASDLEYEKMDRRITELEKKVSDFARNAVRKRDLLSIHDKMDNLTIIIQNLALKVEAMEKTHDKGSQVSLCSCGMKDCFCKEKKTRKQKRRSTASAIIETKSEVILHEGEDEEE